MTDSGLERITGYKNYPRQVSVRQNVNFAGNRSLELIQKMDSYMPASIRQMKKLSSSLGEVQNIIINAIGTGIIAPIFIRYNFLSDTDENTRKYSAMREPISAVLAIATQISALIPFNKILNDGFNTGVFADDYNTSAFKNAEYLKKKIKKQNPNLKKAELEAAVRDAQKEQNDKLIKDLLERNTVEIEKHQRTGTFTLSKKLIDNAANTTIDNLIKEEKTELDRLMKEKREHRIRRNEFYYSHNKELMDYMSEVDRILEQKDLRSIKKDLKSLSKSVDNNRELDELRIITQELLDVISFNAPKSDESMFIEVLKNKSDRIKVKAGNLAPSKVVNKHAITEAVDTELSSRIKQVDRCLVLLGQAKDGINNGKSFKEIEKMFEAEAATNEHLKLKGVSFVQQVAETLKRQINGNTRSVKQIGGLILGLIILPFTCYLLNKVYPVIMDKFFPEISNSNNESEAVKHG